MGRGQKEHCIRTQLFLQNIKKKLQNKEQILTITFQNFKSQENVLSFSLSGPKRCIKVCRRWTFYHLFVSGPEWGLTTPTHKEKTSKNINQHFTHVYNKYFAGKLILKCVNLTIKLGVFHSICLLLVLTMLTKKELSGSARQREVYV